MQYSMSEWRKNALYTGFHWLDVKPHNQCIGLFASWPWQPLLGAADKRVCVAYTFQPPAQIWTAGPCCVVDAAAATFSCISVSKSK
jgi:hypothetical protein